MDTKKILKFSFLAIFLICSTFVLIASFRLLNIEIPPAVITVALPKAPASVSIDNVDPTLDLKTQEAQLKLAQNKLNLYSYQLAMYTQEVNAFKLSMENEKSNAAQNQFFTKKMEVYKLVIKESLITILTGLMTAIAVYVFAETGVRMLKTHHDFKIATLKSATKSKE